MAIEAFHINNLSTAIKSKSPKLKDMAKLTYLYFKVSGDIEPISELEASKLVKSEANDWQHEICDAGTLYTENLDLVFLGNEFALNAQSLKYNKTATLLKNNVASRILGFEVFGDCILESQSAPTAKSVNQLKTYPPPIGGTSY